MFSEVGFEVFRVEYINVVFRECFGAFRNGRSLFICFLEFEGSIGVSRGERSGRAFGFFGFLSSYSVGEKGRGAGVVFLGSFDFSSGLSAVVRLWSCLRVFAEDSD